MALNSPAILSALKTLVDGISGVQTAYVGMPQAPAGQLVGVVTLGGQEINDKATGKLLERDARFRVHFGYALGDLADAAAVEAAELAMAAAVDLFLVAMFTARESWINDATLGNIKRVDVSAPDDPRYAQWPGDEFRLYPLLVVVSQRTTY